MIKITISLKVEQIQLNWIKYCHVKSWVMKTKTMILMAHEKQLFWSYCFIQSYFTRTLFNQQIYCSFFQRNYNIYWLNWVPVNCISLCLVQYLLWWCYCHSKHSPSQPSAAHLCWSVSLGNTIDGTVNMGGVQSGRIWMLGKRNGQDKVYQWS